VATIPLRTRLPLRLGVGAALAVLAATGAIAQTSQAEKQAKELLSPNAYRIEFKAIPELKQGKIAMAEGTAGPDGVKFAAENISILQPIVVTVLAKNPDDDVRVGLSKYRYDQFDRTGSTKGKGIYTTRLRTQGDLKVVVSAPTPTPFQLVVWAGDEVQRQMKPVVVADRAMIAGKKAPGGAASGGGSMVMWVIAIALLAIVGLLATIVLRGKRA
jgi:hypothetical protein